MEHGMPPDLLVHLSAAERELLRRYRVRLRVDKVTDDGRSALCSGAQVQRRFLRADHASEQMIAMCHEALSALHHIGISPLIGWLPRHVPSRFPEIDPQDPFSLRKALGAAGFEQRLLQVDHSTAITRSGDHRG